MYKQSTMIEVKSPKEEFLNALFDKTDLPMIQALKLARLKRWANPINRKSSYCSRSFLFSLSTKAKKHNVSSRNIEASIVATHTLSHLQFLRRNYSCMYNLGDESFYFNTRKFYNLHGGFTSCSILNDYICSLREDGIMKYIEGDGTMSNCRAYTFDTSITPDIELWYQHTYIDDFLASSSSFIASSVNAIENVILKTHTDPFRFSSKEK